jgi:uncharacterized protein (DUF983 family)
VERDTVKFELGMSAADPSPVIATQPSPRARWVSFKRGLAGRCPACGEGRIFRAYLKVADRCSACGEELHHHRADDAPPYFTLLIVCHVVGTALLLADERFPHAPIWLVATLGLALAVGLSLWLLPIVKGALIGWQWALRMHGFGATPSQARYMEGT